MTAQADALMGIFGFKRVGTEMKTIEQARRELFSSWFESLNHRKPEIQYSECGHYFSDRRTEDAWQSFNAALDAVVIELPPLNNSHLGGPDSEMGPSYEQVEGAGYNFAIDDCRTAIESTNLGLKIR